jgi:predicted phosphodiesterase
VRLHLLSDLHLEFAPFTPPQIQADVVVLAGDVHTGMNGFKWIREAFPRQPVIYVLGNHEFYGEQIPKLTEDIKAAAADSNIHVLENDRVEIGGVVFLGATLWTDFRLHGDPVLAEVAALAGMPDFLCIRVTPSDRTFRPADARQFHARTVEWLARQMEDARGRRVVVVTHHAPSPQAIPPQFRNDPLNPGFVSNLDPLITASGAVLWVHGHTHQPVHYRVGATRVIANPRGYPHERRTGFDPSLTVEV